jgi:hypothetical protein
MKLHVTRPLTSINKLSTFHFHPNLIQLSLDRTILWYVRSGGPFDRWYNKHLLPEIVAAGYRNPRRFHTCQPLCPCSIDKPHNLNQARTIRHWKRVQVYLRLSRNWSLTGRYVGNIMESLSLWTYIKGKEICAAEDSLEIGKLKNSSLIQSHPISRLCPLFDVLKTRNHNVSETGSFQACRWPRRLLLCWAS